MAESVDGDIRLKVGLTTRDAKKAANDLKKTLTDVFGARAVSDVNNATKQVQKLESAMDKAQKKVLDLSAKMDKLGRQQIPTQEYKLLQKEAEQSEKKLGSLYEQLRKVEQSTKKKGKSEKIAGIQAQIKQATQDSIDLENQLKSMEVDGTAFTKGVDTSQYQDLSLKLNEAWQNLDKLTKEEEAAGIAANNIGKIKQEAEVSNSEIVKLTQRLQELKNRQKELELAGAGLGHLEYDENEREIARITSALAEYRKSLKSTQNTEQGMQGNVNALKTAFLRLLSPIKNATKALSKFGKISKSTALSSLSLGSALKTVMKYGLGIRGTFALFRKIRGAIKEGFGNLAQVSDSVNKSISSVMSALTQLKNALATAFAPLLNIVAPILTKFINYVSQIVTKIGMLIAALTGASTFKKAVAVQQDYAGSLKKSTKATKELNKESKRTTTAIDELNVISSDAETPQADEIGDSGITAQDMFQDVEIPSSIKQLADKIKKLFMKIWEPFEKAWEKEGANTIASAKYALQSILGLIVDIGKSWLEVWTNGTGQKMIEIILRILQNVFNLIGNIANAIDKAWKKNDVGTRIIQGIMNGINIILEWIEKLSKATADWAAELDFYPLLSSIANLIEKLSPLWDALGKIIYHIWTEYVLPFLSWVIETGLPKIIDFIGLVISALSKVAEFLANHPALLDTILALVIGIFAAIKLAPIITAITTIISIVGNLITLLGGIGPLISMIVKVIAGMVSPIGIAIALVVSAIVIWIKNWESIKEAVIVTIEIIKEWLNNFHAWMSGDFLSNLEDNLGFIGDIVGGLLVTLDEFIESIKQIFSGIIDFISGIFAGDWNKAWEGIKTAFIGVWETMATLIKGPVNIIIGVVNGLIYIVEKAINGIVTNLNKLKISVPSWVPQYGGQSFGFNISQVSIPRVPYLAQGAVIPPNKQFLAMLGDQTNGTNLEAPESLIRQIVREEAGPNAEQIELLRQQVDLLRGILMKKSGITSNELFESVQESAQSYTNRTGQSAFA